jgi:hypothetical protein
MNCPLGDDVPILIQIQLVAKLIKQQIFKSMLVCALFNLVKEWSIAKNLLDPNTIVFYQHSSALMK